MPVPFLRTSPAWLTAPSFKGELLPAVTVPMPGIKAGFKDARALQAGICTNALVHFDQLPIAISIVPVNGD